MPGEGKTVVASTGVGSAVVAVTATGGVGYGKVVIGVLSGATEMTMTIRVIRMNSIFQHTFPFFCFFFFFFFFSTSNRKSHLVIIYIKSSYNIYIVIKYPQKRIIIPSHKLTKF